MAILIRRRKSKKQRALNTVTNAAKKVAKVRLAWAGAKTGVKFAVPAVAVGAAAAIAKRRSGGSGPPPRDPQAARRRQRADARLTDRPGDGVGRSPYTPRSSDAPKSSASLSAR